MGIKEFLGLKDEDVKKPLPVPSKWSKPFWDAAKQHKFVLKRCKSCGFVDHPPYLYCTNCSSEDHEWFEASGKARLGAWAINQYMVPFPFWDDMPYVVGFIELPEGPRMISNIVQCEQDKLTAGMELELVWDDVSEEISLPKWRPVSK